MGAGLSSGIGAIALCASLVGLVPSAARAQANPAAEGATIAVPRGELVRVRPGASSPAGAARIQDGGGSDDLPEVEGFTAAGGTTVSLGGRFRTSVTRRRDGHGAQTEECVTDPAVSPATD